MHSISIKNRKNQTVVIALNDVENAQGIACIMHGLGGFKEQPQIQTFARAFQEKGYTTILFDTTNTFGESDGNYEGATVTNYYEDLEDVIGWASKQDFYTEPFFISGHSLGGMCAALYAEQYPEKVKGLAPISTVVSGTLSLESPNKKESIEKWKATGWYETPSESKPSVMKRLKWSHMEDRLTYDLLEHADALTMPVLMIVGEWDDSTIPEHQRILFDRLPGKKEFHIIQGAPHTFREQKQLDEIKQIFLNWIGSIG